MSRVVDAIFKDGEVRPLEPLDLPDDTRLRIIVDQEIGTGNGDEERRRLDPLATIYEIAEDAGPEDLSVNLDHYLYDLPKQR